MSTSISFSPSRRMLALLAVHPLKLLIHLSAALTALAVGIVIMTRPKGRALHKALGWVWVTAMAVTAASSSPAR